MINASKAAAKLYTWVSETVYYHDTYTLINKTTKKMKELKST